MKIGILWKRRLALLYVSIFVGMLLVDTVVNSTAYRSQIGSDSLKLLTVGFGLIFWVWMLVDLMTRIAGTEHIKRPWLWSIFVVLTYVVGAFVYFIVIYQYANQTDQARESNGQAEQ